MGIVSEKNQFRALIADDEPVARALLRRMLARHPDARVVAEADDGDSAVRLAEEHRPDVLFLDIQMPGTDGLNVAGAIRDDGQTPAIVFVTAFDRFAAAAFTLDAADYLLKPFDEERFDATWARVRRRLGYHADGGCSRSTLAVTDRQMTRLLPVASIESIQAAGNYVEVTTTDGCRHLVREPLARLADELSEPFVRVSRTTILRSDRIIGLASLGRGDTCLTLADGTTATLTRRFRAEFARRSGLLRSRSPLT